MCAVVRSDPAPAAMILLPGQGPRQGPYSSWAPGVPLRYDDDLW